MISRRPDGSPIGVTHSDSQAWIACDQDVLTVWPDATGYSYIAAYEGWPNWSGPNVVVLWEVFGKGCPIPKDADLMRWGGVTGAFKRAQHVFLLPDVLDVQPLLIYRAIGAPDPQMVRTAVERARLIKEDDERKRAELEEIEGDS